MARTKVRNYHNREHYETLISNYFKENATKVLEETVERMGYKTVEEMPYHDIHDCWYDCGWVLITPRSSEQSREWRLDSRYDTDYTILGERDMPYGTQSTTIKKIMVDIAIRELGLQEEIFVYTRLD